MDRPNKLKLLSSNVVRLSRLLTREREKLPAAYLKDQGLREAYQAYFLPSNLQKVQAPLDEIALYHGMIFEKEKLRILDLGCGPGSASLGVLEFFAAKKMRPSLEFVAVDQVGGNLEIAAELFILSRTRHGLAASLKTVRSGIEHAARLAEAPFELIILSNVLNELFVHGEDRIAKRTVLVKEVLDRFLSRDGNCIIIEPALRETSRELLQVRDGMLDHFSIYAPCFCRNKCPALENPKDWCHEDIPWEPPAPIRELDRLTGLRKESLKFSYLVLGKDGKAPAGLFGENAFRVVSEPLVSKGKIELYLCGENGRRLAVRLDKNSTPRNEAFSKLRRGDVACFEHLIDEGNRLKIGKETSVLGRLAR